MLTFDFVVEENDREAPLDSFTPGYMVVSGDNDTHPSLSAVSSTWLVPLVQDLLYVVLAYLTEPTAKETSLRTMYGDYGIKLFRNQHGVISVYSLGGKEKLLCTTTAKELRGAVWTATGRLYTHYAASNTSPAVRAIYTTYMGWDVETDIRQSFEDLCNKWVAAFPDLPNLSAEKEKTT